MFDIPRATVVIPCHRADTLLPTQLDALARQVDAPDFEVVLVDNGGNVGLELLAAQSRDSFGAVRVVAAPERQGAGYARNVGIGAARAELLLFCDADDLVMPEFVALGVQQFERHPVFSGGAVPVSESIFSEGWERIVGVVGPHSDVAGPLPPSGTPDYPILMGGSFGIRRDLAVELGGFDVSFGSAAEDNDLAFRIVESGLDLPDAGQVCIAYRIRDESATFRHGYRSALAHALLCARHRAWAHSRTYSGRWPLRPLRTLLGMARQRLSAPSPQVSDRLGRELGAVIGWLRFRAGLGLGRPELGIGIATGELHR